jgi:hypothetical protein
MQVVCFDILTRFSDSFEHLSPAGWAGVVFWSESFLMNDYFNGSSKSAI